MSKRTHLVCGLIAVCAILSTSAAPGPVMRVPADRPIQLAIKREGPPSKGPRDAQEVAVPCEYTNFQKDLVDLFVASQKDPAFPFWIETADDFVFVDPIEPLNKCVLDSIVTGFAFFNCGDVDGDGDFDQDDCAALGLDPATCWTGIKVTIFEDISAGDPVPGDPGCHEFKQPAGYPLQAPPRDHFDCLDGAPSGLVCELKVPMDKVTVTANPDAGAAAWDVTIFDLKQFKCVLHKNRKYWIAVSPEQDIVTCHQTGIYMHPRSLGHEGRIWFPFFPPPVTWVPISTLAGAGGIPRDVAIDITANKVGDCAADFDGDGLVGIIDFLDLLGRWGPCPLCLQDLDGDGNVGIVDFLTLLSSWGPCA